METTDLHKDPYFSKNHLGMYECRLWFTLHTNEGSYLAHSQQRKHQANLAAIKSRSSQATPAQFPVQRPKVYAKNMVKIGKPGYKITK